MRVGIITMRVNDSYVYIMVIVICLMVIKLYVEFNHFPICSAFHAPWYFYFIGTEC